jgi:hypothetical protein
MTIERHEGGAISITGAHVPVFRLVVLRSALALEIKGIRAWRGRSAYMLIKQEFGLRGNRESVLAQFEGIVAVAKASANTKEPSPNG